MKYALFILIALCGVMAIGCGGPAANSAANNASTNKIMSPPSTATATPPPDVNLPPPGANVNTAVPAGPTPTPRDPKKSPQRPGATPTPGIPSADEIRKQMSTPRNPNNEPPGNSAPMMKGPPMMKTTKTPHP